MEHGLDSLRLRIEHYAMPKHAIMATEDSNLIEAPESEYSSSKRKGENATANR